MKKVIMKSLLASLVITGTITLTGCAGMQAAPTPLGSVVSVVDVPGVKQADLYSNSKIWVAKSFTSANDVIQYSDKEQGSIVGRGNVPYPCTDDIDCMGTQGMIIKFTMKIDTKDNKARIAFDDIRLYRPASINSGIMTPTIDTDQMTVKGQERVKGAMNGIVTMYKKEIMTQSTPASKDW